MSKSAEKPKFPRSQLRSERFMQMRRRTSSCTSVFSKISERHDVGSSTIFKTALFNSRTKRANSSSPKISHVSDSVDIYSSPDVSPISMGKLSPSCPTPSPDQKKRVMLENSRGIVRFWNNVKKKRDSGLAWLYSSIFRALRIRTRSWGLDFKVKCAVFVLLLFVYAAFNVTMCLHYITHAIQTRQFINLYCYAVVYVLCVIVSGILLVCLFFLPYAVPYHLAFNIFAVMYYAERGFNSYITKSFAIGLEGTYVSLVLLQVIIQNPFEYLWLCFFFVSMLALLIVTASNYNLLVLDQLATLDRSTYVVERLYSLVIQALAMSILVISERRHRHDTAVVEKVSRDIEVLDLKSENVRRITKKKRILCSNIQLILKTIVRNMRIYKSYLPERLYEKEVNSHNSLFGERVDSHGTSISSIHNNSTPNSRGSSSLSSGNNKSKRGIKTPDSCFEDSPDTSTLSSDGFSDYVIPANSPSSLCHEMSPTEEDLHSWDRQKKRKKKKKKKKRSSLENVLGNVFSTPKLIKRRGETNSNSNSTPPGPDQPPKYNKTAMSIMSMSPVRALLLEEKVVTYMIVEIFEFRTVMAMEECDKISKLLCLYIRIIKQCVEKYHGVIEVISGDRVGVSFNAAKICVNHQGNACEAALALEKRFVPLIQGIQLNLKICVCTGQVLCGNVGCSTLKRFTLFGDCVTMAPLLNSVNHSKSTQLLIDSETYKRIRFEFRASIADVVKYKARNLLVYSVSSQLSQANEWLYNIEAKQLSNTWNDFYERAWEDLRKEDFESAERNVEEYVKMRSLEYQNKNAHDFDRYLKVLKIRIAEKAVPEI